MSPLSTRTGLSLPALRGRQGARVMYLVLPANNVLNTFFTTEMEPVDDRSQRPLDPAHAKKIGRYITENPTDYALGAITYGVDVEGEFEPVQDGADIGVLHLPLDARLRSIDGQHRRQGLKEAIDVVDEIGRHNTALLLYVEPDLAKRKQMFSDMNNTARVVSKGINVAFDSRDPFARAVNTLITQHPLLQGRIETQAARLRSGSDALFTLGAVYDAVKRLFVGTGGRVRDPGAFQEAEILERGSRFMDLLQKARPEFDQVRNTASLEELRAASILFSSTTLKVLAGAVYECVWRDPSTGDDITELVPPLSTVDFHPNAKIWRDTGFISAGKATPNARAQEVRAATRALAELLHNN